ncbi:uncharacterized protein RJT20DRAFT_136390 [Scheffersomyces xylosifermentans]|uniref:uncharacterized protein n=1 Tax=Scheffersomyces xylosifermentans TaxID=1304137 RepID=UPI00315D4C40
MSYLKRFYENPMPEDIESEAYIQDYFNSEIKPPINSLYKKIDTTSNFGLMRFFAPLTDSVIVESDVVHIWGCKNPPARSYPEMCFAIGDYNRSNYKLNEGFERMMELIRNYQQNPADANQLFFPSRLWTSAVCFTLLLRKYLYQAMICGTNRVFLSDHNTFSGFFEYNFNENGIMNIEYYIIGNPETVSDGITLRIDRLDNVGLKCSWSLDPSWKPSSSSSSSSKGQYIPTVPTIVQDNGRWNVERDIFGIVFVKKYYYDRSWWKENNGFALHEVPERDAYYNIFFNELKINHTIAESQYASNFPKILCSGYWNGLGDHLVHIFEYLGQEMPEQE